MSLKFLIVDDSKAMQTIVKRILFSAGYKEHRFHFADNGKQALDEILTWQPDMVLLDWHMPEMTGIELLNKVNELKLKTKIGLVTAEKNEASIKAAKSAGAIFIVNKPFTVEKLKESLIPALAGVSPIQDESPLITKEILFPSTSAMSVLLSTITGSKIKVEKIRPIPVNKLSLPCMLALYGDSDKNIKAVQIFDSGTSDYLAEAFASSVYRGEAFDDKLLTKSLVKALSIISVCFHSVTENAELSLIKTYNMPKLISKVESMNKISEDERLDLKFTFENGEVCHSIITMETKSSF